MKKLVITKAALPLISIGLSALLLIGCTDKRQPQSDALARYDASFDRVWDACLESLEGRGFEIDRRDRRFGLIVTKPTVGKQFFEFWRGDTADSTDLLNSSLHTIRRVVTIRIGKQGPMQFQVNVQAHAQRVSVTGAQLDNPAEARELLSRQGVRSSPTRGDYVSPRGEPIWVDIGREGALEQAIMRDIASRLDS